MVEPASYAPFHTPLGTPSVRPATGNAASVRDGRTSFVPTRAHLAGGMTDALAARQAAAQLTNSDGVAYLAQRPADGNADARAIATRLRAADYHFARNAEFHDGALARLVAWCEANDEDLALMAIGPRWRADHEAGSGALEVEWSVRAAASLNATLAKWEAATVDGVGLVTAVALLALVGDPTDSDWDFFRLSGSTTAYGAPEFATDLAASSDNAAGAFFASLASARAQLRAAGDAPPPQQHFSPDRVRKWLASEGAGVVALLLTADDANGLQARTANAPGANLATPNRVRLARILGLRAWARAADTAIDAARMLVAPLLDERVRPDIPAVNGLFEEVGTFVRAGLARGRALLVGPTPVDAAGSALTLARALAAWFDEQGLHEVSADRYELAGKRQALTGAALPRLQGVMPGQFENDRLTEVLDPWLRVVVAVRALRTSLAGSECAVAGCVVAGALTAYARARFLVASGPGAEFASRFDVYRTEMGQLVARRAWRELGAAVLQFTDHLMGEQYAGGQAIPATATAGEWAGTVAGKDGDAVTAARAGEERGELYREVLSMLESGSFFGEPATYIERGILPDPEVAQLVGHATMVVPFAADIEAAQLAATLTKQLQLRLAALPFLAAPHDANMLAIFAHISTEVDAEASAALERYLLAPDVDAATIGLARLLSVVGFHLSARSAGLGGEANGAIVRPVPSSAGALVHGIKSPFGELVCAPAHAVCWKPSVHPLQSFVCTLVSVANASAALQQWHKDLVVLALHEAGADFAAFAHTPYGFAQALPLLPLALVGYSDEMPTVVGPRQKGIVVPIGARASDAAQVPLADGVPRAAVADFVAACLTTLDVGHAALLCSLPRPEDSHPPGTIVEVPRGDYALLQDSVQEGAYWRWLSASVENQPVLLAQALLVGMSAALDVTAALPSRPSHTVADALAFGIELLLRSTSSQRGYVTGAQLVADASTERDYSSRRDAFAQKAPGQLRTVAHPGLVAWAGPTARAMLGASRLEFYVSDTLPVVVTCAPALGTWGANGAVAQCGAAVFAALDFDGHGPFAPRYLVDLQHTQHRLRSAMQILTSRPDLAAFFGTDNIPCRHGKPYGLLVTLAMRIVTALLRVPPYSGNLPDGRTNTFELWLALVFGVAPPRAVPFAVWCHAVGAVLDRTLGLGGAPLRVGDPTHAEFNQLGRDANPLRRPQVTGPSSLSRAVEALDAFVAPAPWDPKVATAVLAQPAFASVPQRTAVVWEGAKDAPTFRAAKEHILNHFRAVIARQEGVANTGSLAEAVVGLREEDAGLAAARHAVGFRLHIDPPDALCGALAPRTIDVFLSAPARLPRMLDEWFFATTALAQAEPDEAKKADYIRALVALYPFTTPLAVDAVSVAQRVLAARAQARDLRGRPTDAAGSVVAAEEERTMAQLTRLLQSETVERVWRTGDPVVDTALERALRDLMATASNGSGVVMV